MSRLLEEIWRQQNPIAFAKAKKSGSRKKDKNGPNCKNSTECNVGGKRYCIPDGRICGGKQRKAADPAKVEALRKSGGQFDGYIGGKKNGIKYTVTPEMLAQAHKLGVSQGMLKEGRVPTKAQTELRRVFNRMTVGDSVTKPPTPRPEPKRGGAIVPLSGALRRNQQEDEGGEGERRKSSQKMFMQFNRVARSLITSILVDRELTEQRKSERHTAESVREEYVGSVKVLKSFVEETRNKPAEQSLKAEEQRAKWLSSEVRAAKKKGVDPSRYEAKLKEAREKIKEIKADPEAFKQRRIEDDLRRVREVEDKMNKADLEAEAAAKNKELDDLIVDYQKSIDRSTKRLERAWAAVRNESSFTPSIVETSMRFLGHEPTGNFEDDFKSAKTAFRQRARETHPDMGGDPREFRNVTKAWDRIRTAQITGGIKSELDEYVATQLEELGIV